MSEKSSQMPKMGLSADGICENLPKPEKTKVPGIGILSLKIDIENHPLAADFYKSSQIGFLEFLRAGFANFFGRVK